MIKEAKLKEMMDFIHKMDEEQRNKSINHMIKVILEDERYSHYSGDEIAIWSDENIYKTYKNVTDYNMVSELMSCAIHDKEHFEAFYNNPLYAEKYKVVINALNDIMGLLENEND